MLLLRRIALLALRSPHFDTQVSKATTNVVLATANRQLTMSTATVSVPGSMKGIQIKSFGGPEVLQYKTDLPVPVPKSGEILVKNDFIGINYVDVYWRIGMMGHPSTNGILGREGEGSVISTGSGNEGVSANGLKVGDRVVWLSMGGYAEYTVVPASTAYVIPSDVEPGLATAAFMQGLTALVLTRKICQVRRGDWVLVHAAAGGVGLWLCQLLRDVGARIIGTASTAEKIELAKENGAEFMINYKIEEEEKKENDQQQNLVKRVVEGITGGQGVKYVYDGIGKDQAENNVDVVAKNGTIVTFGAASGMPASMSTAKLAAKNVRFVGPGEASLMSHLSTPRDFERWCTDLFEILRDNKVNVRIHRTYPLSEMVRVHIDLQGRKTTGKVLVKP